MSLPIGLKALNNARELEDTKANREQSEWIRPTILNGWVDNLGSTAYPRTEYMKDEFGFVHIRGHVGSGAEKLIFTLPVGYRPPGNVQFAISNNHTNGETLNTLVVDRYGGVSVGGIYSPNRPSLNVSFKAVE